MPAKSGSGVNNRDSRGQRLGVKCYAGETVKAGSIIVRQRGSRITAGANVKLGRDYTLFSLVPGIVKYEKGGQRVTVIPAAAKAEAPARA
jgi:large subunit ribosomal protein L27